MAEPKALYRRRDMLVEVSLDPAVQLPDGRLDPTKVDVTSDLSRLSHLRFALRDELDGTKPPGPELRLQDFLLDCKARMTDHHTRQQTAYELHQRMSANVDLASWFSTGLLNSERRTPLITEATLKTVLDPPIPPLVKRPDPFFGINGPLASGVFLPAVEPQGLWDWFSRTTVKHDPSLWASSSGLKNLDRTLMDLHSGSVTPVQAIRSFPKMSCLEEVEAARAVRDHTESLLPNPAPHLAAPETPAVVNMRIALLALEDHLKREKERFLAQQPSSAFYLQHSATIKAIFGTVAGFFGGWALIKGARALTGATADYFTGSVEQYREARMQALIASGSMESRKTRKSDRALHLIRSLKTRPGRRIPVPFVTTQGRTKDLGSEDLIQHRILTNIVEVERRTDCASLTMNGFMVSGQRLLVPVHFFCDRHSGERLSPGTEFRITTTNRTTYRELFDPDRLAEWVGTDSCLYQLRSCRSFRDVSKHFVLEADLIHHQNTEASLVIWNNDRSVVTLRYVGVARAGLERVHEGIRYAIPIQTDDHGKELEHYSTSVFEYRCPTFEGDCGAPLIAADSLLARKILGFHVAALVDEGLGYSEIITREMLNMAFEDLDTLQPPNVLGYPIPPFVSPQGSERVYSLLPGGNCEFVGVVEAKYANFAPSSSDLRKSKLFDLVRQHVREPAALSPFDYRLDHLPELDRNLYARGQEKYTGPTPVFDPVLWEHVREHLLQETAQLPVAGPVRVLTLDEAVSGLPYEYYDALNPKSSPGIPYRQMKLPGTHGKETFLEFCEQRQQWRIRDSPEGDLLRQAVADYISRASRLKRSPSVWTDCLKDELRPIEKVRQGKTRLFVMSNLCYLLVGRMYVLPYLAALKAGRMRFTPSCVGINPQSVEWTSLARMLLRVSPNLLCLDYSNYDGSIGYQPSQLHTERINFWMALNNVEWRPEDDNVRWVLGHEACHAMHVYQDLCYMTTHGNMSGVFDTVDINTDVGEQILCYSWLSLAPPKYRNLQSFRKYVALAIYGDDNVVAVAPEVMSFFNGPGIQSILTPIGMTVTSANKSGEIPFVPIDEATFLKCGFRRVGHSYYPTMDLDTIYDLTNWIRETDEPDRQLEENLRNAQRFAWFHGKEFFSAFTSRVLQALTRVGLKMNLFTFSDLTMEYFPIGQLSPDRTPVAAATDDLEIPEILTEHPATFSRLDAAKATPQGLWSSTLNRDVDLGVGFAYEAWAAFEHIVIATPTCCATEPGIIGVLPREQGFNRTMVSPPSAQRFRDAFEAEDLNHPGDPPETKVEDDQIPIWNFLCAWFLAVARIHGSFKLPKVSRSAEVWKLCGASRLMPYTDNPAMKKRWTSRMSYERLTAMKRLFFIAVVLADTTTPQLERYKEHIHQTPLSGDEFVSWWDIYGPDIVAWAEFTRRKIDRDTAAFHRIGVRPPPGFARPQGKETTMATSAVPSGGIAEATRAAAQLSGDSSGVPETLDAKSSSETTGITVAVVRDPLPTVPELGLAIPVATVNPLATNWTFEKCVDRPTPIAQITWTTAHTPMQKLLEMNLPYDGLVNDIISAPFFTNQFWRGDISIDVEIVGNGFFAGRLRAWWFPMFRDNALQITNKTTLSQVTGVYLDASKPYRTTIEIPWQHIYDVLYTLPVTPPSRAGAPLFYVNTLGVFGITVWNPLVLPASVSSGVTVNVYMRIKNAQFSVPYPGGPPPLARYMAAHRRPLPKNDYVNDIGERFLRWAHEQGEVSGNWEVPERLRLFAVPQGNYSSVSYTTDIKGSTLDHSTIPTRLDGAEQTASADFDVKAGKRVKADKPNVNDVIGRVNFWRRATPNLNAVNGICALDRATLHPSSSSPWTHDIAGTTGDETSFANLIERYSWTESFNVTTTTVPGSSTPLTTGFLAPLEQIYSSPPGPHNGYAIDMSINDYVAMHHRYWRGGFKFRVTATCSNYHNCQLVIAAFYGSASPPVTWTEALSTYYYVFTLNGEEADRSWEFTFPWHGSQSEWKIVPSGGLSTKNLIASTLGCWAVYLQSQLTTNGDVGTSVTFDVEQAGTPDTEYYWTDDVAHPYTFGATNVTAMPQGKEVMIGPSDTPTPNVGTNKVVTEYSCSFAELGRRWTLSRSLEMYTTLQTAGLGFMAANSVFMALIVPASSSGLNTGMNMIGPSNSTGNYLVEFGAQYQTQYTLYDRLVTSYRFVRGTRRYMFSLVDNDCVSTVGGNSVKASVDTVEIEFFNVDDIPVPLGNSSGNVSPANPGDTRLWNYLYAKYGITINMTDGPCYLVPFSTGIASGNGNTLILNRANPIGFLEAPFVGMTPKRVCSNTGTTNVVFPAGDVSGISQTQYILISYRLNFDNPANLVPGCNSFPKIRIHTSFGDDFNFSGFLGFPQVYLNKTGATPNFYPLFPSTLVAPLTREMPKLKPNSGRRRTKLVEVEESDTDDSVVFIRDAPVARPQGKWRDTTAVPGTLADFLLAVKENRAHLAHPPPGLPRCTVAYRFFPRPNEDALTIQAELRYPGKAVQITRVADSYELEGGDQKILMDQLVTAALDWAIIHANEVVTQQELIRGWLASKTEDLKVKKTISVINEMVQQLNISLGNVEGVMTGPSHAPSFTHTLALAMADGSGWADTATAGSKKQAQELAAENLVSKILKGESPVPTPTSLPASKNA